MPWTRFMDMHSGGGQKEDFSHCYIEAPEGEAKSIFFARFGHNPERVTCTCCGDDYTVDESDSLEQATGYDRNLRHASPISSDDWSNHTMEERREANSVSRYLEPGEPVPDGWFTNDRYRHGPDVALDEYLAEPHVCVIRAADINDGERHQSVPEQGYVWQD